MKRKYKIISKTRFYLFVFTLFSVVTVSMFLIFDRKEVHSIPYIINHKEVEVSKGDTIWDIAKQYLPEDTDIRKLIYEIKELNNMTSLYIYPGDIIKIPIDDIAY